jgi:putative flippase GtrA
VGFLADAVVLQILVGMAHLDPLLARFGSFAIAVLVTFSLHQCWTFPGSKRRAWGESFVAYLAVQGLGFAVNLVVYALIISMLPPPMGLPLVALAAASALALIFNYAGARIFVFGKPSRDPD